MAAGREITAVALKKGHMATAASRAQILNTEKLDRRTAYSRQPALRLLLAERSDDILPILRDELVRIPNQRAFVTELDFASGQVRRGPEVTRQPKYTKK